MRTAAILLSIVFISFFCGGLPLYSQAIIIDHNCTDASQIPAVWLSQARSQLRCSYGHTSHGSQLITGMEALMNDPDSGSRYNFNQDGSVTAGFLSIADYTPDGDLGNPDFTTWEARTRDYLDNQGSDRNVVIWSWCGQVSDASTAVISQYLSLMNGLEQDYPDITFVYMTGHLDGSGTGGNLNQRNNQIRNYCRANNKVLFDFADIESYDPDGSYFLNLGADDGCNYSGGNWAQEWISANPYHKFTDLAESCGDCAHSERLNCILKGNAAWWLMARIAGWNGGTVVTPAITVTSPHGGETWLVNSTHAITWTYTGTIVNVRIEYSTNSGSSWTTIIDSTPNTGSYSWQIPNTPSTHCLVRVSDTGGSPTDTSNNTFTISAGVTKTITVQSPNGGEEWKAGSSHNIAWQWTGSMNHVKIQYSTDGGNSWKTVTNSVVNNGSYQWTIPDDPSEECLVKVSEAGGGVGDTSDGEFTIVPDSPSIPPVIALNRVQLNFAYMKGGANPDSQWFQVMNTGGGTLAWQVSTEAEWLGLSPTSGTKKGIIEVSIQPAGLAAGEYNAEVRVTDTHASNSPVLLPVSLIVLETWEDQPPFGSFDSPADGAQVEGSIAVTGWALDDVGIDAVKLYYEKNGGLTYIGEGIFVDGARPDIEQGYPDFPMNYQAGWGYMLLTHFLPNGGNGTYTLHAIVKDSAGHEVDLGSKTIICDNAHAVEPFGAIDTPAQGGIAGGKAYINFGWALTPVPNTIPKDGSTIKVWVDGVNVGHPDYNHYREDIAALFPGYKNTDGAIGYYILDTTAYENGVHTISWSVKDNAGNEDGIGSRYFSILNGGTSDAESIETSVPSQKMPFNITDSFTDYSQPVIIQKGFSDNSELMTVLPGPDGFMDITARQLERIEIALPGVDALSRGKNSLPRFSGYSQVGEQLRPLPPGSTLDTRNGMFYWQLGLAYSGEYRLVFFSVEGPGLVSKRKVRIRVD